MALDDGRIAELLAQERDVLLDACPLPAAREALLRVRLRASRRRAARVSSLIDHLVLALGGLVAVAVTVATILLPLSDRVFVVVVGAVGIGGAAVLAAHAAMRTTAGEARPRDRAMA